ncbi:uncharacterized protein L201_003663 [Kwoniella dendrophila CBS 6074]|uniref:Uncharacterized protein n=1 Tax=Kwoniella dendrophila CBS 6074 TaxID=1295534 RepID=A0AAX4JTJ7_9TREE
MSNRARTARHRRGEILSFEESMSYAAEEQLNDSIAGINTIIDELQRHNVEKANDGTNFSLMDLSSDQRKEYDKYITNGNKYYQTLESARYRTDIQNYLMDEWRTTSNLISSRVTTSPASKITHEADQYGDMCNYAEQLKLLDAHTEYRKILAENAEQSAKKRF